MRGNPKSKSVLLKDSHINRLRHGDKPLYLVEETIRFTMQSYNLEDLRVLDYDRLKNLVAIVLAVAVLAATVL